MTRYYFHTADGHVLRDAEGEELPHLEAVKHAASMVMSEALPSVMCELWQSKRFSVSVKDDTGRLVAMLTVLATLDPEAEGDVPPET